MSTRNACGLLTGLVLTTALGCANTNLQDTVRGQSPADAGRVTPAGGFYGDTSGGVQQIGCTGGQCGQPGCNQCPPGGHCSGHRGCSACGGLGCGHCAGGAWYPTHHHWFDYDPPRNLTYPAANVPPAVVVYPYYTVKAPDDFFKAN